MRYDTVFTNGVIKSREKLLLGRKILQMAEGDLPSAVKTLRENGYGGSGVSENATAEELITAEEKEINSFIKTYSPDEKTERFLLAEYDFHNAEALVKCRFAGALEEKTLLPEGSFTIEEIKRAVFGEGGNLPPEILGAIIETAEGFEKGVSNGLTVDCVFKKAMFEYMKRLAKDKRLKAILTDKADSANVSVALRSRDFTLAEKMFVVGGKLSKSQLKALCEQDFEEIYEGKFSPEIKQAVRAIELNNPLTEFEKRADDFAFSLLFPKRFEMAGKDSFLLYVIKRRAEVKNARIVTVCLSAGLTQEEISRKIRLY